MAARTAYRRVQAAYEEKTAIGVERKSENGTGGMVQRQRKTPSYPELAQAACLVSRVALKREHTALSWVWDAQPDGRT